MLARNRLQVKPTRVSPRPAARFGAGILPYVGQHDGRQPYTGEDLAWAAQLFGELSDRHDSALPGPGRDEPDYALDPIDDDALADLAEHLEREEAIDPTDLDAWEPGPYDDDLAGRYEQQELAEAGISGPNRGFWAPGWGHLA